MASELGAKGDYAVSESAGMFAIVDVTNRTTRGMILMLLDDQDTAMTLATELGRRSVAVVVRSLSAEDVAHVRTAVPVA